MVFGGRPGLNGLLSVPAVQSFGNWQMVTHPDDGLFQLAKAAKCAKNKGLKGFLCLCITANLGDGVSLII